MPNQDAKQNYIIDPKIGLTKEKLTDLDKKLSNFDDEFEAMLNLSTEINIKENYPHKSFPKDPKLNMKINPYSLKSREIFNNYNISQ